MTNIMKFTNKLKSTLSTKTRYYLIVLYFALIFSALLEMISLGSVPIFVSILIDPQGTKEFFGINIANIFNYFDSEKNITELFAFFIVIIFTFKAIFIFCTTLFELKISKDIKLHFSENLLKSYIFKPYIFFVNKNSAELSRNLVVEVNNAAGFLHSIINLSREIALMLIIFSLLIFFDPLITIGALTLLTLFSIIFYSGTNNFIKRNAVSRLESIGEVYKSLFQSFGAIKDLKVYKKENYFLNRFKKYIKIHEKNILSRELIVKSPKIIFELTGVLLIILVTFIFIYLHQDVSKLLPALSLIAVCTIRLMPSFSSISSSLTYIRSWKNSFDLVEEEISKFKNNNYDNLQTRKNLNSPSKAIEIKDLTFSYPDKKSGISVKNISLDIKKGEMVGIIGKSGAGKSTIANIILSLLAPSNGEIKVYNSTNEKTNDEKNLISYIPQDIFLMDDTLRRNVAFGEYDKDIDDKKIMSSLRDADLIDFIKNQPKGLDLIIGERGIKLSGGERQRLGIARALYRSPEILIMDEATSSLDNHTERQVMSSIKKLKKKHTIIMIAHRLSTIENCDRVYLIENGEIKDSGQLKELKQKHPYLSSYNVNEKI